MIMKEIDFKRIVFASLGDWTRFAWNAVRTLLNGVLGVLFAVFTAIISLAHKLWTLFKAFVRRRPLLSVALVIVVMNFVAIASIMNVNFKAKTYEHQRDSIAYELMKYKQAYTTNDTVLLVNDTTYIYCK